MEKLQITPTEDTPEVLLDKSSGKFVLSGRSLPEDAASFYAPVIAWLNEYSNAPLAATNFEMKLEYFNTASSKLLLDVLSILENISNAKVIWHFFEDDEDMEEAGEEFSELVEVPFEFKVMN